MDDSSIVWKCVRPVDSVTAAVAHQGQAQGLDPQNQGQGYELRCHQGLAFKTKVRTTDHNFVIKDNQGTWPRTTSLMSLLQLVFLHVVDIVQCCCCEVGHIWFCLE